jgi:competence protein ComEC
VLATVGLLLLAIPVSRLRFASAPFLALAFFLAAHPVRPDVLVDSEAEAIAVRGNDGRLTVLNARQNRISAESWLAADGDTRKSHDPLEGGFRCDVDGCIARLADGTVIAVARRPDAFADDCREAALVVSKFDVPRACATAAIDRHMLATTGAIALKRVNGEWRADPARSPFVNRPWYGRTNAPDPAALMRLQPRSATLGRVESQPMELKEDSDDSLPNENEEE